MLRLPPFIYLAPATAAEAAQMLAEHGPDAMLVAGGSDVLPNMKRRQRVPKVLISLRRIGEMTGISGDAEHGFRIGACATLAQIAGHAGIQAAYPALAKAADSAGTPPLRTTGTIGGNLCLDTRCNYYDQTFEWRQALGFCLKDGSDVCRVAPGSPRCLAVSSCDTAPVLCSLDARVRLVGPAGERTLAVQSLFGEDGINYLAKQPEEVLTEVLLPPPAGLRSAYWKLRRRASVDFPVLGVAVALQSDDGVVRKARIVLGAVASHPLVAVEAEALLAGQQLSEELIDRAAEAAAKPAKPLDMTDLDYLYRKKMARVYVRRALRELAGLPSGDEESESA